MAQQFYTASQLQSLHQLCALKPSKDSAGQIMYTSQYTLDAQLLLALIVYYHDIESGP
jgi:hypothetical protein